MKALAFGSLSLLLILGACSEKEGAAKLAGAIHPTIPVFEPSDLDSSESYGFSAGSDFSDLSGFDAIAWELSSPRPYEEVVAYYEQAAPPLPDDEGEDGEFDFGDDVGDEGEDSEAVFSIYPNGVDGDIEIEITVEREPVDGRTKFTIIEIVPESRR